MILSLVSLALFSRCSVARSNASPMIAISMLRNVIWMMKVEIMNSV